MPEDNIKNKKLYLLRKYFGYDNFRNGQEALIDALLSGRDVMGIMPTGGGKSMCYQIPALILDGVTLVISPLISLMKDQVEALKKLNIPAAYINSSLSGQECSIIMDNAANGAYKIIYVAPERILTPNFINFSGRIKISLLAVDEAHCVSQWGQNFRPDYRNIAQFNDIIFRLYAMQPPIGAFTATATATIRADIYRLLNLKNPLCITTGFDRPNLYFKVMQFTPKAKAEYLIKFIKKNHKNQSGIVYCSTKKAVEKVCESLKDNGIRATRYHAGLDNEERVINQEDFISGRKKIIVATTAFGMGIDKPDVRFVVHYNMPHDVESYYQEAGRAGRDGFSAECLMMFSPGDINIVKHFINKDYNEALENGNMSVNECEAVKQRDLWRLKKIEEYCKYEGCFRAYLLNYFGENPPLQCDNCGNCEKFIYNDITIEAQKILSAVRRVEKETNKEIDITLTVRMLKGSEDVRILKNEFNKIKTYGAMRNTEKSKIREYITYLIERGYLYLTNGKYPKLHTVDSKREAVFNGEKVWIKKRRGFKKIKK